KSDNKTKTNKNNTNNEIADIKKIIIESLKNKENEISNLKSNINELISKNNKLEEENKILKKILKKLIIIQTQLHLFLITKEVEKIKSAHAAIVSVYNLKNNITEFVIKDIIIQKHNTVTNHINNINRDINKYLIHNKLSKSIIDTSMNNIFNQ
ncbi:475_t:CDS:2, partial [Cetraspora pellucida]